MVRTVPDTRILVTGATGRVGRHVLNKLLERGYRVRAITSKPTEDAPVVDGLEWCHLDFEESLEFRSAVRECAAVIHLAAEIAAVERMQRVNAEATRALADASERAGVSFFCYISSVSVYGSSRRRTVAEASDVLSTDRDIRSQYWVDEPLRSYAQTKLRGELAISEVAHEVDYVILRPTVVVDVADLLELGSWTKAMKMRASSRHAHFVYVDDVADAIVWFLERGLRRDKRSAKVTTYNLADDDAQITTYRQIFAAAYRASGDLKWHARTVPWLAEWLWSLAKFRMIPPRHSFGRMMFSSDKLQEAGYSMRTGMAQVVDSFCAGLGPSDDGAPSGVSTCGGS